MGNLKKGCIHIYCGDGKGKTTAAVGLSVRAAGSGMKVLFCQCMKDGSSSELSQLEALGIRTLTCPKKLGFYWKMNDTQKAEAKAAYTELFRRAVKAVTEESCDLLVIDEFMSACRYGWIDRKEALEFLVHRPEKLEVVLTGRDPEADFLELADYVTEMKKVKHPFEHGLPARKGIEL